MKLWHCMQCYYLQLFREQICPWGWHTNFFRECNKKVQLRRKMAQYRWLSWFKCLSSSREEWGRPQSSSWLAWGTRCFDWSKYWTAWVLLHLIKLTLFKDLCGVSFQNFSDIGNSSFFVKITSKLNFIFFRYDLTSLKIFKVCRERVSTPKSAGSVSLKMEKWFYFNRPLS